MTEQMRKTLKDSAAMRWTVMVMVSVLMFATYWFQDFFSGLKPLMESQLGISSSEFGALIGLTTIANVFGMIIVGGMFLDRFGIRWTAIVFGSVVTFGAALTAVGAHGLLGEDPDTRLNVMIAGRVFFGTGLEVTCVLVTRTMVKWFKGYELALAMALNVAFGRGGSAIGTMFSIDIGGGQVPAAVTFAATLVGVGFIMFLAYLMFDVKLDKQLKEQGGEEDEPFRFSDLFKLITDKSFIYITLLCVAFYSAVFPFMQYAPDLLINKFGFTLALPDMTGWSFMDKVGAWLTNGPKVAGLLPLGTILLTPVFGSIMDKKGRAASLMMLGSVLLIFAHLALSVFNNVYLGYAGLVCLGAAFSLVPAAMWPSVAKIVAENRLGTAYATMFTIQNWGLLMFFWGIGRVVDLVNPEVIAKVDATRSALEAKGLEDGAIAETIEAMRVAGEIPPYDYTIPILILVGLGVISIFLAYMLKRADAEQGYGLENPSAAKK
jgi:MFS family permease